MKITEAKIISPLEKLYAEDKMPEKSYDSFSMLKNEKKSFQVAIEADEAGDIPFSVVSDIKKVEISSVKSVKSDLPMFKKNADDYYRFSKNGYYPDLLLPAGDTVHLEKGITVFWIEVDASETLPGKYTAEVKVADKALKIDIEIIDAELDFSDFAYTCWYHTDSLMTYYNVEAFSEEYWRITANFLRTACEYGMNCVLTPIFTPPLDTEKGKERPTVQLVDISLNNGKYSFNFDKLTHWIEMAEACGIRFFELAHFYTQWGAKAAPKIMATVDGEYKRIFGWDVKSTSTAYKNFLKVFSTELKKYFEDRDMKERVFIHVSDEPSYFMNFTYRKVSGYIHKLFKGYKIIDALSDYRFYDKGVVSNPVPAIDHIDKFLGNVDDLWAYYCSAQCNHNVSNRFFCNDSIRTRVIGYQLYKYNIRGFLQWGYNFYFTRLSKKAINPFEVTDAGAAFPSGDSFMVYPAPDGTAYHSLRLKVFYDALQDRAALTTLENLCGKEACLDIIEEKGKHNLTFREYPHSDEWLLSTREKINMRIKEEISK